MVSVRGVYEAGKVRLLDPVRIAGRCDLIVTFLEDDDAHNSHHADRAWRRAVQGWLETHAVIRVVQTPSVSQLPTQNCDISCVA